MKLKELRRHWNCFAKTDPIWAIDTKPEFKDNKADLNKFFLEGRWIVDTLLQEVQAAGLNPQGRALDFGCGVGRLTRALAAHFERCDGVDIAPRMIKLARASNPYPNRCFYTVGLSEPRLPFPSATFDFVLSIIVLQHIRPEYSKLYITDFARVLKSGGVAVFHVPSARQGVTGWITPDTDIDFHRGRGEPIMLMDCVPQEEVIDTLGRAGARVVRVVQDESSGPDFESFHYIAEKTAG